MDSIRVTVDLPMDAAEQAVREALAGEGFGVLTEIDVAATLKAKLGVERPLLKILGACNPHFADQALQIDPSVSLVLPCNVVLSPAPGGGTVVSVVDPRQLLPNPSLDDLAEDAARHLRQALERAAATAA